MKANTLFYVMTILVSFNFIVNKIEKGFLKNKDYYLDPENKAKFISILSNSAKNIKCFWANGFDIYSFKKLKNEEKDYTISNDHGTFTFNFCQNTLKTKKEDELGSTLLWDKGDSIVRLTGPIEGIENSDNEADLNIWSKLEEKDEKGIQVDFAKGDICSNTDYHKTIFKVYCDEKYDEENLIESMSFEQFNPNGCNHTITLRNVYGCSYNSLYLLTKLMNEYKGVFIAVFIIVGLFFTFLGSRLLVPTVIITWGIFVCYLVTALVLNFFTNLIKEEQYLIYLMVGSLIIGIILGICLKGKIKAFIVILGFVFGYLLGSYLYQIVQPIIENQNEKLQINPDYIYYGFLGIFCLLGAIVSLCLIKVVLILGSSLFGSSLIIKGASLIFGHYTDPTLINDLIKAKEYQQLKELITYYDYIYLASWAILFIVGSCYQWRHYKGEKDHKKKRKDSDDSDYKSKN